MNWIAIATKIGEDPKIGAIASASGLRLNEAIGAVVRVLCKLPAHAGDGVIADVPDETLEEWGGFRGEPGVFAQAFRKVLCTEGTVTSWEKYNGAAQRRHSKDRDRQADRRAAAKAAKEKKERESTGQSMGRRGGVRGTVHGTVHGASAFPPGATEQDNTTTPSGPDGPEPPSLVERVLVAKETTYGQAPALPALNAHYPAFAAWEGELREAGLPHEQLALDIVLAMVRPEARYTVIGELYAIASGQHVLRGESSGRPAGVSDVMRALSEFANSSAPWRVPLFRGFVRRLLDRPAEPPTAEEREAARLERDLAAQASRLQIVRADPPESPEEKAARARRREEAMARFKADFFRNTQQDARLDPSRTPNMAPIPITDPAVALAAAG